MTPEAGASKLRRWLPPRLRPLPWSQRPQRLRRRSLNSERGATSAAVSAFRSSLTTESQRPNLWLKLLLPWWANLREMTNAGMMDCKKALAEAKGDLSAAVDILRKKGAASATHQERARSPRRRHHPVHRPGRPPGRAGRGQLPDRLCGPQRHVSRLRRRRGQAAGCRPQDRL